MPEPPDRDGQPLVLRIPPEHCRAAIMRGPAGYAVYSKAIPRPVKLLGPHSIELDLLHLFAAGRTELERNFPRARSRIKKIGTIVVSWPKRPRETEDDLDEEIVRYIGLANGLEPVEPSVSGENWFYLRFAFPCDEFP